MNVQRRLLFALLTFLPGPSLLGQTPPPPRRALVEAPVLAPGHNMAIVSGTATIAMAPDLVFFSVGVQTDGPQIAAIVKEKNAAVSRIVSMLKTHGVPATGIRTSGFTVRPVEKDEVRVGYRVSNKVYVSAPEAASVGDLLEQAIGLGANDVEGPDFGVSNEKSVQDRCLALAFGDAKAKATQLATLSGQSLGPVQAVSDGSSSPFEFKSRFGLEGGVLAGIAMEPGTHTVECGVTVAFALEAN